MVFVISELIDVVIMTLALGFIFKDMIRMPSQDPMHFYNRQGFNWDDFKFACLVIAPSIILHEMGHKFLAMGFGMSATFHAAYMWLGIGVALKLLGTGFIFFIPGYVTIYGVGTALQFALISFAGPFVHLVIWLGSKQYLQTNPRLPRKTHHFWALTMQVNKFLFILNMLPIPGFDGWGVYSNLIKFLF